MNWITTIIQLISFRKSFIDSKAVIENAQIIAARGKGFLVFFLFAFSSLFFLLSGLILAIIEYGLQIDRGDAHSFSGLMQSSAILVGLGFIVLIAGSFFLKRTPTPPPAPPKEENKVKDLLEEFIFSFLSQLIKPKDPK